jgi:hypothetical protein
MKAMTVLFVGSLYKPTLEDVKKTPRPPGLPVLTEAQEDEELKKRMEVWREKYASFKASCWALGAAFAANDWTIMVGIPEWKRLHDGETVANHVIAGANSAPLGGERKVHEVIFYGPRATEPKPETKPEGATSAKSAAPGTTTPDTGTKSEAAPDAKEAVPWPVTLNDVRTLPKLHVDERTVALGSNNARLIPNVSKVDAVVVIAGGDGTANIGYAAYSMNKPVIAVSGLGGTAAELERDVLAAEYERYKDHVGISDTDLRALRTTWSADPKDENNRRTAEQVARVTSSFVKAWGQTETRTRSILKRADVGLIGLLVAWVWTYLLGSKWAAAAFAAAGAAGAAAAESVPVMPAKVVVSFFALLWITSLLGCGLRLLSDYRQGLIARLEGLEVLTEVAVAMIVAFGLCLFYLIGGITITGEVVALAGSTTKNFAMLAVAMSLLGLAAGFLVPIDMLRERLQNQLGPSKAAQPAS